MRLRICRCRALVHNIDILYLLHVCRWNPLRGRAFAEQQKQQEQKQQRCFCEGWRSSLLALPVAAQPSMPHLLYARARRCAGQCISLLKQLGRMPCAALPKSASALFQSKPWERRTKVRKASKGPGQPCWNAVGRIFTVWDLSLCRMCSFYITKYILSRNFLPDISMQQAFLKYCGPTPDAHVLLLHATIAATANSFHFTALLL